MDAHGLLAVEQRVRDAAHLAQDHIRNGPGIAVGLQRADVEADRLLDDIVVAVRDEEGPIRQVDDAGHDDDAGEEGGVVLEARAGEADEGGDVLRRGEAFGGVDFARLRRQQHLAGLHADVYAFDAAEAQVAARPVQHDGAAGVDHVGLEEHFVDGAVVGDHVELRGRQVQPPVAEVLVDDVDGVVFEGRVEAGAFEDFAEDADGVDEVGKGAEDGERGEEGRVVVVLESGGVGDLLLSVSAI